MSYIQQARPRLRSLCENLCRPYGARINFPLYPALKRWAIMAPVPQSGTRAETIPRLAPAAL